MKDTIILDLDGTLCNCEHRNDWAQVAEWDMFHSQCHADTVYEDMRAFLRMVPSNVYVLAVTGRSEKWRAQTLYWLADNDLSQHVDHILMRPDNSYEKAGELKIKLIEEFFDGPPGYIRDRIIFALDDSEKVVEAFRNYGIPCWQVRTGSYA